MKKGIILQSSEIFFDAIENTVTISGTSDPREIRKSLLYWDKIAIPRNNHFKITCEEIEILIDHNLAEEVNIILPSNDTNFYTDTIITQLLAHQKLQELNEDAWTLGQYNNIFQFNKENSIDSNIIEIKLINALPCPPNDTPIFEILEFKEKHGSRIQTLQYEIEDYTTYIINSISPARAEDRKLKEINKIIEDIRNSSHRSWIENIIPSFQLGISISDSKELFEALIKAYAVYQATSTIGLGDLIPSITALGTGIAFAPKIEKTNFSLQPFDSLYYMEKEFPGATRNSTNESKKINEISNNFKKNQRPISWNQSRISQCWCASGKRFKDCHGALK